MSDEIAILPSEYGWIPLIGILVLLIAIAARVIAVRLSRRRQAPPQPASEGPRASAEPQADAKPEADAKTAPRGLSLADVPTVSEEDHPEAPHSGDTASYLLAAGSLSALADPAHQDAPERERVGRQADPRRVPTLDGPGDEAEAPVPADQTEPPEPARARHGAARAAHDDRPEARHRRHDPYPTPAWRTIEDIIDEEQQRVELELHDKAGLRDEASASESEGRHADAPARPEALGEKAPDAVGPAPAGAAGSLPAPGDATAKEATDEEEASPATSAAAPPTHEPSAEASPAPHDQPKASGHSSEPEPEDHPRDAGPEPGEAPSASSSATTSPAPSPEPDPAAPDAPSDAAPEPAHSPSPEPTSPSEERPAAATPDGDGPEDPDGPTDGQGHEPKPAAEPEPADEPEPTSAEPEPVAAELAPSAEAPTHPRPGGRTLAGPRGPQPRPTFESLSGLIDDQMGAASFDFGPARDLLSRVAGRIRRGPGEPAPGPRVSPSTFGWLAVALGVLALFAILCFNGQVEDDLFTVAHLTVTVVALGALALLRDPTFAALERLEAQGAAGRVRTEAIRAARDLGLLVLGVWMGVMAIEMPWNPWLLTIESTFVSLEAATVALAVVGLYFLFQRHGAGPALGVAFFLLVGIAQYFVREFKDVPIVPTDLYAIGTAQAVAGQYSYVVGRNVVRATMLASVSVMGFAFMRPGRYRGLGARVGNLVGNLACFGLVLAALVGFVQGPPSWSDAYGTHVYYWELFEYYETEGFIPTFVTIAQDLPVQEPQGYSDERAQELTRAFAASYDANEATQARREKATAQFEAEKPNVVVVMNETFADMSLYEQLHANYNGPQFFRYGMPDSLAHGPLSVSVRGGGTCNTEFEFLTGNSLAWIGSNKYPYSMYDLSAVDNLARQFKSWGYTATAMHPNLATNWNRDVVFRDLGFDRFESVEDFREGGELQDWFHNGVPDYVTYQHCLDLLREGDEPQFVMDVTMQNHGGYEVGNIPERLMCDYQPSDFDDGEINAQLNEYLACIEGSDRSLEWFVSQLAALDEPVVLVFFGDHQASFVNTYNNGIFAKENGASIDHWIRTYSTDYVVWANYDVAGLEDRDVVEPATDTRLRVRTRRDQFDAREDAGIGRVWEADEGPDSLWGAVGMRYDGVAALVETTVPAPAEKGEKGAEGLREVATAMTLTDDDARAYLDSWLDLSKTWASSSDLATITLDLIGAPLSDFQKAQLALRDKLVAVNGFAYLGDDGTWYELNEKSDYQEAFEEFRAIDYLNFGSKVRD